MAERGAHLTTTFQQTPSIFEVVAQDSLAVTIHPAVQRIAVYLASCNPEKFGWLVKWFDELYLGLNFVSQVHYLKHYAASFAENFYALQRVSLRRPASQSLPGRERLISLLCLVLLPYARLKLEALATRYRLEEADGPSPSGKWSQRFRRLVIVAHSTIHLAWEGAVLAQYILYMSGRSPSHSPLLTLAGVTLRYMPERPEQTNWKAIFGGNLRETLSLLPVLLGEAMTRSVEVGAFFLQFLQWWNTRQTHTNLLSLPVPPPPLSTPDGMKYGGICPICLGPRKTETVLSVSGFVFCYRCIAAHLKEKACCPVTKYPASADDLIRIYGL